MSHGLCFWPSENYVMPQGICTDSHMFSSNRLLSAMDTALSLEKVPRGFSLFEHYADSPGQGNQHALKHVAGKNL